MKKIVVFFTVTIIVVILGIGGYFLGRQMNFFLSDQEILAKSLKQLGEVKSFSVNGNISELDDSETIHFTWKQILAQETMTAATEFTLEGKEMLDEDSDDIEMESWEFVKIIIKDKKLSFRLGDYPLLGLFRGKWLFIDLDNMEELDNMPEDYNIIQFILLEGMGEGSIVENSEKVKTAWSDIKMIFQEYIVNNNFLIVQEKLGDSEQDGIKYYEFAVDYDEEILKEMLGEIALVLDEEKVIEDFDFLIDNIKIRIQKSNFELANVNFELRDSEEKELTNINLAIGNYNRLNESSIKKPEAVSFVNLLKFLKEEAERRSTYVEKAKYMNAVSDYLNTICENAKKSEQEQRQAIANGEMEESDFEEEVFKVSPASLIRAEDVLPNGMTRHYYSMTEATKLCDVDSDEPCVYSFADPLNGKEFDGEMTYVDSCDYWLNFYTDTGIGHLTENKKEYPLYKKRSFEQYKNNEYPELEYYDGDFVKAVSFRDESFILNDDEASSDSDSRREAALTAIKTAMALTCSDGGEILLDADIFKGGYIDVRKASGSDYIDFTTLEDPSGKSNMCTNDSIENCQYSFADPDGNGELLPLETNADGQIIINPCHYRIYYYMDESGVGYSNEKSPLN